MIEDKYLGIIIILMSAIVFIILYNVSTELAQISHSTCSSDPAMSCTVYQHIPVVSWVAFPTLFGLGIIGSWFTYSGLKINKASMRHTSKSAKIIKNLDAEEKKILDIVSNHEGSAFQSDLVRESNYTKVKVSRILDKLEMKGLIERRRRGMANLIVMK